ncbi:MAG: hypothetical protein BYD32DRAFT_440715 [Podila humilis]|nr:MAG: hypothetical protein BYD32DRAFT_440715 [Podila humilis]
MGPGHRVPPQRPEDSVDPSFVDCFFHAAVSLLYASPFKFVLQDNRHKPLGLSSPPVSTASVISQSPTSIKPEQSFTVAGLLSRFELQFVGGHPLPPLLQDTILEVTPTTTTDYARFLTVEVMWDGPHTLIDFMQQMAPLSPTQKLQLRCKMSMEMRLGCSPKSSIQYMIPLAPVLKSAYLEVSQESSFQCCPESVASVTLRMSDSLWYLPLAHRLESLETVYLIPFERIEARHLEDATSFFAINHSTFPCKKPVYIDFDWRWSTSKEPLYPATEQSLHTPHGQCEFHHEWQQP